MSFCKPNELTTNTVFVKVDRLQTKNLRRQYGNGKFKQTETAT